MSQFLAKRYPARRLCLFLRIVSHRFLRSHEPYAFSFLSIFHPSLERPGAKARTPKNEYEGCSNCRRALKVRTKRRRFFILYTVLHPQTPTPMKEDTCVSYTCKYRSMQNSEKDSMRQASRGSWMPHCKKTFSSIFKMFFTSFDKKNKRKLNLWGLIFKIVI